MKLRHVIHRKLLDRISFFLHSVEQGRSREVAPNTTHRCILLWKAVKGDIDAVKLAVTVAAEGLLNFTATVSDSDIVIVSGPTGTDNYRIYLPLVRK